MTQLSVGPQFHRVLQHMVLHYGPSDRVEFRLNHEGWVTRLSQDLIRVSQCEH